MFANFNNDYQEVIFFFDEGQIVKEMYYSEFEAVLDGVVGLSGFSGKVIRSAYLNIDSNLSVVSCVLFKLSFDREGRPPQKWNLPLRNLADRAGEAGIDGHYFRLACRSQCSISWYAKELWDPELNNPEIHTLSLMMQAVEKNSLNLQCIYRNPPSNASAPIGQSSAGVHFGSHSHVASSFPLDDRSHQRPALQVVKDTNDKRLEWRRIEQEQRDKLAAVLTDQRNKMKKVLDSHQEEIANVKIEYERRFNKSQSEITYLTSKAKDLEVLVASLSSELETLQKKYTQSREKGQVEAKKAVERVTEEYEKIIAIKVADASSEFTQQMRKLESEMEYRKQVQAQLREELADLRKEKLKWTGGGLSSNINQSNDALDRLNQSGIKLVVFHAGVGYITLQKGEVERYITNPLGFVAERCLVTEEHYRAWLSHYNRPVCGAREHGRQVCGESIHREDIPSSFVMGHSDCCHKHRGGVTLRVSPS